MNDLPRCWAYNLEGVRCEKRAGHTGDHLVSTTWNDDECYAPDRVPATPQGKPLIEIFAKEEEVVASKCVACQHMHRGGVCKCGCHEHIG